ncbi:MAG: HAD family hydrolase [Halomonadaceae bacterium]|nr:MAG: HAD family hydrolase [Halomonadaceae bacterium]
MTNATPRPSAVLFDLDGTLIDTAPDFIWCLNRQRASHGLPPLPPGAIRAVVSHGAKALVKLGFDLTETCVGFPERHQELLGLYMDHLAVDTVLFAGMEPLLLALEQAGIPWGIVTNKPRPFTEPLLVGLALDGRCGVTVCPDDVAQSKPHPESLFLAARHLGIDPARALYVGDHERDIIAGRAAGMVTIAARYGYVDHPEEVLAWQADHVIDHGSELLALAGLGPD